MYCTKALALALAAAASITMGLNASAETLSIAGASGLPDEFSPACSNPHITTNEMWVAHGSICVLSYPLNLPAGKVIESIQIAYSVDSLNLGTPNLVAYLGQNRLTPNLGVIAIAGNSVSPQAVGQGFLTMSSLNIPVAQGSTYWVQLSDAAVSNISSISVSYH